MKAGAGRRKVVGKYNLIAEIGHGGMADVFLAVSHGAAGSRKLAVIKEPRPEMAADSDLMAMFLDEARLAARLNHPNIVQTYEVGQDGERYFIAMEFLEGQPLSRIRSKLKSQGGLPLHMVIRVLADTLAGLHYAHELKDYDGTPLQVVHRDVTPQNIFVTYNGHTKVVDFGIAKASSSAVETKAGMLKGKMHYMAPEQARSERVDRRVDIFAAGVLVWEAVAKQRMWKEVNDLTVLQKLVNGDLPKIRDAVPDVPEHLERVIQRALAYDPNDRYPTAAEMQKDLEKWLQQHGERVSMVDLGTFVADAFHAEREKIAGIIDEQLRQIDPRATAESLPRIDPGRMAGTPSSLPGTPTSLPDSDVRQSVTSLKTGMSLTAASPAAEQPPPPSKKTAVFAIAVAVGALAAGSVFLIARSKTPDTPPDAAAPSGTASAKDDPATTVELRVDVVPENARVLLDDAVLSTGGYSGKLPRDKRVYKLRVEAPGYLSRVELVTPDRDLRLSIALEKAGDATASATATADSGAGPGWSPRYAGPARPGAAQTAEPVAAPQASAKADDGLKRQNAPKPSRTLDTDNPYAK